MKVVYIYKCKFIKVQINVKISYYLSEISRGRGGDFKLSVENDVALPSEANEIS